MLIEEKNNHYCQNISKKGNVVIFKDGKVSNMLNK